MPLPALLNARFAQRLLAGHLRPADLEPGPAPPAELGRYRIVEPLGQGSQADVFLAHDPRFARGVVLKCFRRPSPLTDRELVALGERLAQAADPAVVRVFGLERIAGQVVAVLDYEPGATWADQQLPLPRALELLARLARTLNGVHQLGLAHGDLRPDTIAAVPQGRLLDLGLACAFPDAPPYGVPAYLSHERARGGPPTPAGDVYALGAILYELICGLPPFGDAEDAEVLDRLRGGEAPRSPRSLAPQAPRELERIALQALARDPARRHGSALQFAAELESRDLELPPEPAPPLPRSMWLIGGATLGVTLAISVLANLASEPAPPPPAPPAATPPPPAASPSQPRTRREARRARLPETPADPADEAPAASEEADPGRPEPRQRPADGPRRGPGRWPGPREPGAGPRPLGPRPPREGQPGEDPRFTPPPGEGWDEGHPPPFPPRGERRGPPPGGRER